jgi:MFS family permease
MGSPLRERQRILIVVSLALFSSVLVWFNYSAVLPLIVDEWGISGIEAGIIFGAFQAGYLLAILPAGIVADRYSPREVIAVGATGTAIPSIAFAVLAEGVLVGSLLRFLSGIFVAGVYVPGTRFVSDWFPESVRGKALGLYIGTFELGSGLSFVFSTLAVEVVNWRLAIIITSVSALVSGPLVLLLTRDHPDRQAAPDLSFDWSLLYNRKYLSAVSIYSWHNWELFGVRNWLLPFLLAAPAFAAGGELLAGIIVGSMIIMSGIGDALGGWLSDRIGRARTIATGLGLSAAISLGIGFLSDISLPLLTIITLIYGLVLTLDSAPTSTLVTEIAADKSIGTALSLQSLIGFSTTIVSPIVFGLALDRAGYAPAFATLAIGALLGLFSVFLFHRFTMRGAISH